MTDDMSSTIKMLKNKLTNLEKNYEEKLVEVELREKKKQRLEEKLKTVVGLQKQLITFNIGGEYMQLNKKVIFNCGYDNIFKDVVTNIEKMGRSPDDIKNVFIDRNAKNLSHIAEIMRKSFNKSSRDLKICLSSELDLKAFQADIEFYFKQDAENVMSDYEIYKISLGKDTSISLSDLITGFSIKTALPSENLDPYRANTVKDLLKKNNTKALFVSYDSTLVFELKEMTKISSIELKPFSFDLDSWIPSEGAGTFIFGSSDNIEWDFLNSIPDDYGTEFDITYLVTFDPKNLKYIKFQTGEFTLSISYIKVA